MRYTPGPAPKSLDRYVRRELEKIATSLSTYEFSGAVASQNSATISVTNPGVWTPFLTEQDDLSYEWPPGMWSGGEFLVMAGGLYQCACGLNVVGFGLGNRDYVVGVRILVDGTPSQPFFNSSSDIFASSATLSLALPLLKGQKVSYEAFAQHESTTVEASGNGYTQMSRIV